MTLPSLLDVNVLIALFDPDHIHHEPAHDWFTDHRARGWATCPLTENGFVRVVANPRYGAIAERAAALLDRLRRFCTADDHLFWDDAPSLRDETLFDLAFVNGPGQITDVYLLGLARRRGGRLATFDHTIPLKAVVGATPDAIELLGPAEDARDQANGAGG